MEDAGGRWYPFNASMETIMCLEKAGGLPDHLKQMPSIDTPVPLKMLMTELEDSGEARLGSTRSLVSVSRSPRQVNVKLTHHTLTDAGVSLEKSLVFVLDEPKQADEEKKSKKKKKDSGPNHKNFGAKLDVNKMKGTDKFVIGWRCRLLALMNLC